MKHQPWKVIDSKIVYECQPFIRVHSQKVGLPDGRQVEPYFRVDLRSWVVMAAVTPEGLMVVERQYRHGIGRPSLMLPGGLLEENEDPLVTAQRELLEETGYASEKWESLGCFVPNSNYHCGECRIYLAWDARQIAEPNSGDLEESELLLLPMKELLGELAAGNVISLSSVAAISLASARLKT